MQQGRVVKSYIQFPLPVAILFPRQREEDERVREPVLVPARRREQEQVPALAAQRRR
ncbi:MAG: hypothetical protein QW815_05110 [Nitrososphaerota archaeon]